MKIIRTDNTIDIRDISPAHYELLVNMLITNHNSLADIQRKTTAERIEIAKAHGYVQSVIISQQADLQALAMLDADIVTDLNQIGYMLSILAPVDDEPTADDNYKLSVVPMEAEPPYDIL